MLLSTNYILNLCYVTLRFLTRLSLCFQHRDCIQTKTELFINVPPPLFFHIRIAPFPTFHCYCSSQALGLRLESHLFSNILVCLHMSSPDLFFLKCYQASSQLPHRSSLDLTPTLLRVITVFDKWLTSKTNYSEDQNQKTIYRHLFFPEICIHPAMYIYIQQTTYIFTQLSN